jgi:hypothetical protein
MKDILTNDLTSYLILVPLRPLRYAPFNMFSYTMSDDAYVMVPCKIVEKRYKIEDNYKIEVESIIKGFGRKTYYQSDLLSLIKSGHVRLLTDVPV